MSFKIPSGSRPCSPLSPATIFSKSSPRNRGKNVSLHKVATEANLRAPQLCLETQKTQWNSPLWKPGEWHTSELREMEDLPLGFRSIDVGGASSRLFGSQFLSSSCNCSRMLIISGRAAGGSDDSSCSRHDWINSAHNASENPIVGRSGRIPFKTFCMTAASGLVYSKGLRPVIT